MTTLDRRTFLIASGALALAACSSDAKPGGGSAIKTSKDGYGLVPRFDRGIVVPGDIRMPFSLASGTTSEVLSDGPETLRGTILDANDKVVVESLIAKRRRVDEGIVYWDVRANIAAVGQYTLYIDGGRHGAAVSVADPATVEVPYPGQPLPPFDTATTTEPGGVDPLCTRLEGGPCPFHSITLTEALAMAKPVAYLIGTPAHCKFGTCAPGLEFLIKSAQRLGDKIVAVHTEVFVDDTATITAPAVDAYHISGEPDLWITDASGTIVERFEGAWDQTELDEVLDRVVA